MKTQVIRLFTGITILITVIACKDKKAKEADTIEAKTVAVSESNTEKYIADVSQSIIEWKGFKPTGTHNGTVNLESGVFTIADGNLQSGTFVIDMKSIVSLDLEGDYKTNLEGHLKGTVEGKEGDFFNVNKYPTGTFEVTGTETNQEGLKILAGNLTLLEAKYNVSFPVLLTTKSDTLTIASEVFTIDRTKWGINFKSKSIFDNLGDNFINDNIELKIKVVAIKE